MPTDEARPAAAGDGDEGPDRSLVALLLPPTLAVPAIVEAWEAGEAVLPLDPAAPGPELRRVLDTLRPTHVVDRDGRRSLPDGEPAAGGVAAVVVTSGTTGEPKGAELTAAGIEASARAVSAALGAGPGDRWLCCVPPHGVAGLAIVARSWHTGVPVTVHDGFDVERIAADRDATLVSLVPTMLARLLDAPGGAGGGGARGNGGGNGGGGGDVVAARFRRVLLGGARARPELLRRAADAGAAVVTTYGMTETGGGVVLDRRPLPGVEIRTAADGELLLRCPMLLRGYRRDPAATAAALRGGWLHTGDLGRLDAEGIVHVTGRKRDVIITGGVNVAPDEVEAVLAEHPGLAEVAVGGLPDPDWGERVVAWAVPADRADPPTLGELRAFARARLAPPKLPRQLVLVDGLPRTGSGKVLRRELPGLASVVPVEPAATRHAD
jgi:O-succinylbenzoic acid--CoA ligase